MQRLHNKLWSHQSQEPKQRYLPTEIQASAPREIASFRDLVKAVAELSYYNPEHVLFYRGQGHAVYMPATDGTRVESFYPSIYRSSNRSLGEKILHRRFDDLQHHADQLLKHLAEQKIAGVEKLRKFPELAWAILQHYEVCPTPLLDVTHSLRVAASFALNRQQREGYLYVFGFPHPNGSITYSVESELLNIRLLSICPPQAQRPYFQEGFLVGTFPSRRLHKHSSLDFRNRLIAKFKLLKKDFWNEHFHAIPDQALYPDDDRMKAICAALKPADQPNAAKKKTG